MASEIKVDTISENTSAAGVTIDGVLIKDGQVDGKDVSGITSGSWEKLASASASSSSTIDLLQATTGYDGNTYSKFVVNGFSTKIGSLNFAQTLRSCMRLKGGVDNMTASGFK